MLEWLGLCAGMEDWECHCEIVVDVMVDVVVVVAIQFVL